MEGKEILINLLNSSHLGNGTDDTQSLLFENNELKKILESTKLSPNFVDTFLADIDETLINKIIASLEPESMQEPFKLSILFIKGLTKTYSSSTFKFELNAAQREDIYKFVSLIERTITNNEAKIKILKTSNMTDEEIGKIKQKHEAGEIFTQGDYETIEKMIRSLIPSNQDVAFEKVVTYLNAYNGPKLEQKYQQKNEKPEPVKEDVIKLDDGTFNIFEHHSIEPKEKKEGSTLELYERRQKIKEILVSLGYNFDEIDEYSQNLLLNSNAVQIEKMASFLNKTNFKKYLKETNVRGLCVLLTTSSLEIITKLLERLENDYKLTEKEISVLASSATLIFTSDGYHNFTENMTLLNKYHLSIRDIIYKCPSFLMESAFNHKTNLEELEKMGIDIKLLLDKCIAKTDNDFALLLRNIDTLSKYGFEIGSLNESGAYSLLASNNLDDIIDHFIELGLNEHLHASGETGTKNLKALIIKKIYYSFKNGLPVWDKKKIKDEFSVPINEEYNRLIKLKAVNLTEEDIKRLIAEHPLLETVEYGYRPALYSETQIDSIKRQTEFNFDTKIISRPKTYRIFNILIKNSIPEREALLYALTYKSILEKEEYERIKRAVYGNQIGVKTL